MNTGRIILQFSDSQRQKWGGYSDMLELLMKIPKDTMRSGIVDQSIDNEPRLERKNGQWPRLVPVLLSSRKQREIINIYWASRLMTMKISLYKYGL
jgi:hypothetical protein